MQAAKPEFRRAFLEVKPLAFLQLAFSIRWRNNLDADLGKERQKDSRSPKPCGFGAAPCRAKRLGLRLSFCRFCSGNQCPTLFCRTSFAFVLCLSHSFMQTDRNMSARPTTSPSGPPEEMTKYPS